MTETQKTMLANIKGIEKELNLYLLMLAKLAGFVEHSPADRVGSDDFSDHVIRYMLMQGYSEEQIVRFNETAYFVNEYAPV